MSSSVVNFKEKGAVDSLTYPRVSNLDADLLYIGPGPSNSGWALLKKRQTDTCLMYNLEVNNAYSPYNNPAVAGIRFTCTIFKRVIYRLIPKYWKGKEK